MTDPAPPGPIWAETDLDAIRHNARLLMEKARPDEAVAVVKANAYGHGAAPVARALGGVGVRRFAVARLDEAVALREAGVDGPLLVFAAPLDGELAAYERHGLTAAVSSPEVAAAVAERGGLTVHVKVDTGMHRLGFAPEAAADAVRRLQAAPGVTVEALWTHLATADGDDAAFALEQVRRFDGVLRDLGDAAPPLIHVRNGPAVVRLPPLTSRPALARLGGVLYGLASDPALLPFMGGLRPALRLVSRVVHVQTVAAGESVSYGRTWTAERPTRVATLAVGYADGVPRALSNRGEVGLGGRRFPVAGRVCMDLLLVDLGAPDGPGGAVRRGDEAVVFGRGGPSAEEAAAAAGTMAYELTCGLAARVPRVFRGQNAG
ncbi:alanine racemase [Rubrivirga sp. S365]|uniref:alanine racemase n=1 Tax=Rubrivirga sp. S365 TaxID=3076080 RepID=UPI0028C6267E|nr:alanine racemase [Rubrivirga sp. S365]MDT7857868.1 alanine racemase [Rubrivirga sp. S365]